MERPVATMSSGVTDLHKIVLNEPRALRKPACECRSSGHARAVRVSGPQAQRILGVTRILHKAQKMLPGTAAAESATVYFADRQGSVPITTPGAGPRCSSRPATHLHRSVGQKAYARE